MSSLTQSSFVLLFDCTRTEHCQYLWCDKKYMYDKDQCYKALSKLTENKNLTNTSRNAE